MPQSWTQRGSEVSRMQTCVRRSPIWLRPYAIQDRDAVFALLTDLPALYPGGGAWLEKRLDDVHFGRAFCTLAVSAFGPIGVTIETPKGASALKLSTIFVAARSRRLGVGSLLLGRCVSRWLAVNLKHVHVTVDQRLSTSLRPLLTSSGFDCSGVEYDRYGPGRNEVIFRWNQDGPYCNHLDPAVLRGRDLPAREALRISTCGR